MSISAMKHVQYLTKTIGERPAGSRNAQLSADYIRKHFETNGLDVHIQRTPVSDWQCITGEMFLDGQQIPIDVNPFSPACNITAPSVVVGTLAELEASVLEDKIVVLYGELSSRPIFPINFDAIVFERDKSINQQLQEKSPSAIICINGKPKREHIIEDSDLGIPSLTVNGKNGLHILKHLGEQITLHIDTKSAESDAQTVIGTTPNLTDKRIVICAHYDTKFGTAGAWDNASGVASMLTLVEILTKHNLDVGFEFVAWGDEEYHAKSDHAYFDYLGDDLNQILAVVNIDGVGQATGTHTITMLAQSLEFEDMVKQHVTDSYPAMMWSDPWYASNHFSYFARGIPCIALTTTGVDLAHQAYDTDKWLTEAKFAEIVKLVTEIVDQIRDTSPLWTRPSN